MRLHAILLLSSFAAGFAHNCENGGQFVNGSCQCPSMFSGEDCSRRKCINGGYLSNNICLCPPGYAGLSCEAVFASQPMPELFPHDRKFNLIVFNAFSNYYGVKSMQTIQGIFSHVTNDITDESAFNLRIFNASDPNENHFDNKTSMGPENFKSYEPAVTKNYMCAKIQNFFQKITDLIQSEKLQRSMITIVTQKPPSDDDDALNQLIYIANAHQIKINFIFIEDSIFIRCNYDNGELDNIWKLPRLTHGHTAVLQIPFANSSGASIVQNIFNLQLNYELAYQVSSENCASASFDAYADELENDLVIMIQAKQPVLTNRSDVNASISNMFGDLSTQSISWSYDLLSFSGSTAIPPLYNKPALNILVSGISQPCSVKVYVKNKNASIQLFHSFADVEGLDSGYPSPIKDLLNFVQLHATSYANRTSTSLDDWSVSTLSNLNVSFTSSFTQFGIKSSSSANFCSNSTLNNLNMRLRKNTGDGIRTYYRTVPYLCYANPSVNISHGESQRVQGFTANFLNANQISAASDFVLGFSSSINNTYHEIVRVNFANINGFSSVSLLLFDSTKDLQPAKFDNFADANAALFNNYSVMLNDSMETSLSSNILDILQLNLNNIGQNGFHFYLTGGLLPNSTSVNNFIRSNKFKQVINAGQRLFFAAESSQFQDAASGLKIGDQAALQRLSEATGGHFIKLDSPQAYAGRYSSFFNITNFMFQNLLNRRLISTGVTLQQFTVNANASVYFTASYQPTTKSVSCTDVHVVIGNGINAVLLKRADDTNFFYHEDSAALTNGIYQIKLYGICADDEQKQVDLSVRVWADPIAVEISYADLNESNSNQVDSYNGYAARLSFDIAVKESSVTILQCNGQRSTLTGTFQQAETLGNNAYFYPYFCSSIFSDSCNSDVPGIHYAQYNVALSNGTQAVFMRPFICEAGQPTLAACNNTKLNGDLYCEANNAEGPFYRGPSGKLLDCGDHGVNYYNNYSEYLSKYSCRCTSNFEGDWCQKGFCTDKNTDVSAQDAVPRILTYVIKYGVNSDFEDLTGFAGNGTNFWLYQLYYSVSRTSTVLLYSGPDFAKFKSMMNIASLNLGDGGENGDPLILSNVLNTVLAPLGTTPLPGLLIIYNRIDSDLFPGYNQSIQATDNDTDASLVENLYTQLQQSSQRMVLITSYDGRSNIVLDSHNLLISIAMIQGGFHAIAKNCFSTSMQLVNLFMQGTAISISDQFFENSAKLRQFSISEQSNMMINFYHPYTATLFSGTCSESGKNIDDTFSIINLNAGDYCLKYNGDLYLNVMIMPQSATPNIISGFVQNLADDVANAVATFDGVTSLIVYFDTQYELKISDDNGARVSTRNGCTFPFVTYTLSQQSVQSNYNTYKFVLSKDSDAVTRVVPYVVTHGIGCANGGTFNNATGGCTCPTNWVGPGCNLPRCQNGLLGTMKITCNCDNFSDNCETPWKALQYDAA